jgi:ParB-like chromosome segregation protein Spo0J
MGRCLRHGPLDRQHVLRLVETSDQWPPLLVNRSDLTVIDGWHRLAAATELALDTIAVEFFDGSETDGLVEALRRNASHGLPLTLNERKSAARQLLMTRPEWSDRGIGKLCGLAAGTVRAVRAVASESAPIVQLERRVGRDGRTRPARPAEQRRRIVEALRDSPGASARSIAVRIGASPATVRAVSEQLQPPARRDKGNNVADLNPVEKVWASDSACSSADGAVNFAAWFDRTWIDLPTCMAHLTSVPLSRVYEIADEARRRAQAWAAFATALERRPTTLLRGATTPVGAEARAARTRHPE